MSTEQQPTSFLGPPPESAGAAAMYDGDLAGLGFVMNLSRVWAHDPASNEAFGALLGRVAETAGLTFRQRGLLVAAAAGVRGDSYCALAWGERLAGVSSPDLAAGVLAGAPDDAAELDDGERALVRWARQVARDANGTTPEDVAALRAAGLDDTQVFGVTLFVALRLAFSTVNDALGARPDAQLVDAAPEPVRRAVSFGRAPATHLS